MFRHLCVDVLVADYLRSIPNHEPVLIFTHKGDENRVLQKQMRCDLEANGIDLSAETAGLRRINWLTWGNETSINSFSDCKHVILCGITRRNPLELAASVAAQRDDLCYRMTPPEAKAILISEMGHCVLQALSRGACRRADDQGEALPMNLQIFGGFDGLREALSSSLPGVRWHVAEVQKEPSRTALAASAILEYLQRLPVQIKSISVMSLKRSLALPLGADAVREAIDSALVQTVLASLRGGGARWSRSSSGRTLVRVQP
jgi:hypothetical protein